MLTKERLIELFEYKNGNLFWRKCRGAAKTNGKSGFNEKNGYRRTCVDRHTYLNHRLIFLYHNGYMPKFIDHINGIRSDNRIENLREATLTDNSRNSRKCISKVNRYTSMYKGVSKRDKKWISRIRVNGSLIHLGTFPSEIDAAKAYNDAAIKYFGEFLRLNNIALEKV